jgi:hypothetical protein
MRVLAPLLAACLCWGCFAFDEIDAGQKEMDRYGAKAGAAKQQEAANKEEEASPKEQARRWWDKARSISPGEDTAGSSDIVSCKLDGSVRLMSQTDCANSGGKVDRG